MRRLTVLVTSMALVMAGCGTPDETGSVQQPASTTVAVEESTTTEALETAETTDVRVVFDGETCFYYGPAVLPAGTEVTFDFDDRGHEAALLVAEVDEGTTWNQVVESAGLGMARQVPEFLGDFSVRVFSGTIVETLEAGDYIVTCNTSPETTDAVHPGALIQVIEE